MIQGNLVLSVWPKEALFLHGPAPPPGTHPFNDHPMLDIQVAGMSKAEFPQVAPDLTSHVVRGDFHSLDLQTQQQLVEICEQDMLYKLPPEIREVNPFRCSILFDTILTFDRCFGRNVIICTRSRRRCLRSYWLRIRGNTPVCRTCTECCTLGNPCVRYRLYNFYYLRRFFLVILKLFNAFRSVRRNVLNV